MDSLSNGQTVLHYRIIEKIGQGGMGEIYRAEDLRLGRQVAIKILLASVEDKEELARERLLREARSASLLNHPNIVTIHAIEQFEDSDFIVMEYIEGETLGFILQTGKPDLSAIFEIGAQIADALSAAVLYS